MRPSVFSLKRNDLHGLVLQEPVKIGYLGVKTIVQVLRGEKVPAVVDTGVYLATAQNLNDPATAGLMPLQK